ncbi:MAG: hypothetical protein DRN20_05580 [Thermoplasmata archaeon]|nr:MAG: hypothetical protein DRN20_05580 [Thermoplasmata archaeon]
MKYYYQVAAPWTLTDKIPVAAEDAFEAWSKVEEQLRHWNGKEYGVKHDPFDGSYRVYLWRYDEIAAVREYRLFPVKQSAGIMAS